MDYSKNPNNSYTLTLMDNELPYKSTELCVLLLALDAFSCWGGHSVSSNKQEYYWEFPFSITESIIMTVLHRHSCRLKNE